MFLILIYKCKEIMQLYKILLEIVYYIPYNEGNFFGQWIPLIIMPGVKLVIKK